MGFLGGLFGNNGTNFQAQSANIVNPTNADQLNQAYNQSQTGLNQQQSLIGALQGQNGIGNQSNVFNQQQALSNQLALQAQGGGPNPALAQLNQATGQNVANQAALMASQRGTNSNSGLLARQAAQQGAQIQQQAAGQASVLRAQQQLAAQQGLAQQQANMGNLATNQVGQQANAVQGLNQATQSEQQQLLNTQSNVNQQNVAMTGNVNNANAAIAAKNAEGQQALGGGLLNVAGPALSTIGSGLSSAGNWLWGALGTGGGAVGSGLDAVGGVAGDVLPYAADAAVLAGKGGEIPAIYAAGGTEIASNNQNPLLTGSNNFINSFFNPKDQKNNPNGPQSQAGQYLNADQTSNKSNNALYQGTTNFGKALFGSKTNNQVQTNNPEPEYTTNQIDSGLTNPLVMEAHGGKIETGSKLKQGGKVPGQAKVKGDSLKNDNVHAYLSPGEIVIPRSIAQGKNAPGNAAKFVAAILAKNGKLK
jgi:hypothetical protein